MKRRRAFLIALACILASAAGLGMIGHKVYADSLGNGVRAHGALWVDGAQLRGSSGEEVVLRGLSSHGIAWYPRYLNGAAMQSLYEAGANLIRLAMYTDPDDGYIKKPERNLDYLYMGIESALSADLYVIVDWHILEDGDPNQYADQAEAFFRQISGHYGDNPALIYEICNEPNGDTEWEDVVRYARRIIPVIRANAPNALILVGTPHYCTDFSGPMEQPLDYPNIMYTMHSYIDTAQEQPCDTYLIESIVAAGLPVFVSEWGTGIDQQQSLMEMLRHGQQEIGDHQQNAQPFLDYLAEHKISWAAWALSNKDEKHSVLRPDCEKLSGWQMEDLSSFGRLVFENLKPEAPPA